MPLSFACLEAKSFEESVKKAVAQIEESPFMKRTEMASAEQYFQVSFVFFQLHIIVPSLTWGVRWEILWSTFGRLLVRAAMWFPRLLDA